MKNQVRVTDTFNTIVAFPSNAAVGLVVQENRNETFTGAFLSPEDARSIATALNRFADEADEVASRVYSEEEKQALLNRAAGRA